MGLGSVAPGHAATSSKTGALPPSQLAGKLTINSYKSSLPSRERPGSVFCRVSPKAGTSTAPSRSVAAARLHAGGHCRLNGETIVAAAPLFRVGYRIDTPLQGRLRRSAIGCTRIGRVSSASPSSASARPCRTTALWVSRRSCPTPTARMPSMGFCATCSQLAKAERARCSRSKAWTARPKRWTSVAAPAQLQLRDERPAGDARFALPQPRPLPGLASRQDRLLFPSQDAQRKEGADRISHVHRGTGVAHRRNCSTAPSSRARSTTGISKS